jgi:hypothetical protein
LPNQKAAGDAPALQFRFAFQLPFVIRCIEMAARFCNEPIIVYFPKFVATDANAVSRSARAGIRASKRSMEFGTRRRVFQLVERGRQFTLSEQ